MKFLLKLLITILIAAILQQFLPWWIIAVAAFSVTFFASSSSLQSFMIGFVAISLLWLVLAWWIDSSTNSILSSKIAVLFNVGQVEIVLAATALIGGIVGGFGGLSGYYCRKLIKNT